ncbi:MAG: RsmE family RNA methyltransferase [Vulcanimicrobiaceae bacterium]
MPPSAPRFFVDGCHAIGDLIEIGGGDAHKLRVVLRKRSGDAVELRDASGTAFVASLQIDDHRVRARLERAFNQPRVAESTIVLAQAIPKGRKMDFVIEKCTELGVARFVPLITERTIPDGGRTGKVERWRRLARTAAAQCGRAHVPTVDDPNDLTRLFDAVAPTDCILVPWESADRVPLSERLPALIAGRRNLLLVIGPEGGFAHAEVELAERRGAATVSLGDRILRTETAGIVVCSILRYALGEL